MENSKSITAALTLAVSSIASLANATLVTVTETGIIGSGYDNFGTFFGGVSNSDLSGHAFFMSLTLDPALLSTQYENGYIAYAYGPGFASETLTINGVTKTFSFEASLAETAIVMYHSSGNGPIDQLSQYADGVTGNGTHVFGQLTVGSPLGLGSSSVDFYQHLSHAPSPYDYQYASSVILGQNEDVSFVVKGGAYFGAGSITNISLNPTTSVSVPEPESLALVGLGLLGLVISRRHQRLN